ncbi:MAG: hypothetical protein AAGJ08_02000 [Cyanobacteria bacterium P01_H01_bin.35]
MTKLQAEFKIRNKEILDYLTSFSLKSSLPKHKFMILAHYRTGSTLLADLLQSHPSIFIGGEIFSLFANSYFKKVLFPHTYLNIQVKKSPCHFYGFDLKIDQLIVSLSRFHQTPIEFIEDLCINNWKIIYLKRNNTLRKAISDLIANARKQWHDTPETPLIKAPIYIDCQQLIKLLEWYEKIDKKEQQIIQNFPSLKLIYETHLLNPDRHQQTLDKIFSYLGTYSVPVKTKMKKISTHNLADDIINYEEVVDFIRESKYKKFLEIN